MDWVGFPYGDEAQKTVNILLLMASFISVLTWNGRAEQRKAELLQITLLVCEACVVNVDIFSNRVNHWSDLYTNGWNLTWAIGGSLEILEISGLLGIIVRSVLQAIFHLTENLRGAVRWLEQIVQQCDKALLFETIGGVLADWLFISYSGLNQKPEQTILWAIVFGTLWIIAWTIIRLFVCIRKKLLAEVREISIQSSFSIIGEGLILIGLGTLAFWSLSIQQSSVKIILLLPYHSGIFYATVEKNLPERKISSLLGKQRNCTGGFGFFYSVRLSNRMDLYCGGHIPRKWDH